MIAEVLAVGSELLLGQIANSNARDISAALGTVGVEVARHVAVADDVPRIAGALREAMARCGVLVICGGLGPTHDDLTREALALATGRALERRESLVVALEERFRSLGRAMAPANLRQADCPAGAESIPNPLGTAPGVFLEHQGCLVFALPGVPLELASMLTSFVLPRVAAAVGPSGGLVTRTIRTAGIGESDLAERIGPVFDRVGASPEAEGGLRLAILASDGEVRVCLTAARALGQEVAALEAEVRSLLGPLVYGGDGDSLEGVVSARLRQRGLRLAVAESLTGGMLAARLVGVPGASDVLLAGYVAYSASAKVRDLGVPADVLAAHGLVSEETARAMALGARSRAGADVALATTGEAGPQAAEAEVGTVCVGLAWEGGSRAWTFRLGAGREQIRRRACTMALNALRVWLGP